MQLKLDDFSEKVAVFNELYERTTRDLDSHYDLLLSNTDDLNMLKDRMQRSFIHKPLDSTVDSDVHFSETDAEGEGDTLEADDGADEAHFSDTDVVAPAVAAVANQNGQQEDHHNNEVATENEDGNAEEHVSENDQGWTEDEEERRVANGEVDIEDHILVANEVGEEIVENIEEPAVAEVESEVEDADNHADAELVEEVEPNQQRVQWEIEDSVETKMDRLKISAYHKNDENSTVIIPPRRAYKHDPNQVSFWTENFQNDVVEIDLDKIQREVKECERRKSIYDVDALYREPIMIDYAKFLE